MLSADDIERINWYSNMNLSRREGRAEIVNLYKWLFSQNRDSDARKSVEDPAYLDALLAEYSKAHGIS